MADDPEIPRADLLPGHPHPRETRRLFGQGVAERAFLEAWRSGRVHHAWLLTGPQGIGKATLAYRIARTLIATPTESAGLFGDASVFPETLDAPDDCPVRQRILAEAEPQLRVLRRSVNPNTGKLRTQIVVDDARSIKRFLSLSLPDGGWRAIIVDAADELNRSAANAILKILEEPPAQTVMLLVSHNPGGLLPTIRSRCRALPLARLGPEDLSAALAQSESPLEGGHAAAVSTLSDGSAGRALRLVGGGGLEIYARLVAMLREGRIDRAAMMALAESVSVRDVGDRFALVIELLAVLLGRLARHGAAGVLESEAALGERAVAEAFATGIPAARLWAETAERISATARHALAVNLDPAQTMIDIMLDLDETLGKARAATRSDERDPS